MSDEVFYVDPATLVLPPSMPGGVNLAKFWPQFSQYGTSIDGMPPVQLWEYDDGGYVLSAGLTRATRIARFSPGTLVPAIVESRLSGPTPRRRTVGDVLP